MERPIDIHVISEGEIGGDEIEAVSSLIALWVVREMGRKQLKPGDSEGTEAIVTRELP